MVRGVFLACLASEVVLLVLDASISYAGLTNLKPLRRLADITLEANLPTWFASTQALATGAVLWVISCTVRRGPESMRTVTAWRFLAALFAFIALDDASQLHEDIGTCIEILRDRGRNHPILAFLQRYPSYYWHVTLGPLFAGSALFMAAFLWRQIRPPASRFKILFAFTLYAAAIGLDALDTSLSRYEAVAALASVDTLTAQHFSRVIEEFLEMLATTVFLVVFLEHLCRTAGVVQLQFLGSRSE
ncbi:MAG: hypothetical protein HYU36_08995 [Planctomycetes bacterium]|nr:hypothetical protein [Planctomycetota bacterium]